MQNDREALKKEANTQQSIREIRSAHCDCSVRLEKSVESRALQDPQERAKRRTVTEPL